MKITEMMKNLLLKKPSHILITSNKQITRILIQDKNKEIKLIEEIQNVDFEDTKNEFLTLFNLKGDKEQEVCPIILNEKKATITAILKPTQMVYAISL